MELFARSLGERGRDDEAVRRTEATNVLHFFCITSRHPSSSCDRMSLVLSDLEGRLI
eukprot:COSAG06_NODE_9142_length_1975_cov_3.842217_4_plen_56_part_01